MKENLLLCFFIPISMLFTLYNMEHFKEESEARNIVLNFHHSLPNQIIKLFFTLFDMQEIFHHTLLLLLFLTQYVEIKRRRQRRQR